MSLVTQEQDAGKSKARLVRGSTKRRGARAAKLEGLFKLRKWAQEADASEGISGVLMARLASWAFQVRARLQRPCAQGLLEVLEAQPLAQATRLMMGHQGSLSRGLSELPSSLSRGFLELRGRACGSVGAAPSMTKAIAKPLTMWRKPLKPICSIALAQGWRHQARAQCLLAGCVKGLLSWQGKQETSKCKQQRVRSHCAATDFAGKVKADHAKLATRPRRLSGQQHKA